MDPVEVEVNFSDVVEIAESARGPFLDSLGGVLFFEAGALWRLSSEESKKTKVGGGGTRFRTKGERIQSFQAVKFEEDYWSGCEVEEGVYWCARNTESLGIVRIDTRKGEVETLYFGDRRKGVPSRPHGPLLCMMGPHGPQVYYYDSTEMVRNDLHLRMISGVRMRALWGSLHDPSLIRPSQKVQSDLYSLGVSPNSGNNGLLANERIIWVTVPADSTVWLKDLSSGQTVLLCNSEVYPLFAISWNLVLAVQVVGFHAWLILFDWTLPYDLATSPELLQNHEKRYELPKDRITRIAQIPGTFQPWCRFLFDSASNQLHCFAYSSYNKDKRYANVFNISIKTKNDTKHAFYPAPVSERADFATDLSRLLLPDCPLPYDLQLTHSASNTSWNVHYDILNLHKSLKTKEDTDRLAGIIKYSSLPSSSILAFLKFLYFSPPVDLTNPIESFMPLCHCVQLCNQVGMSSDTSNYLLWLLDTKVVSKLARADLLQKILTLWFIEQDPAPKSVETYSESSPLMIVLASKCRSFVSDDEIFEAIENFADFPKDLSRGRLALLSASLTALLSRTSTKALTKPDLSSPPLSIPTQTLKWDENLSVSSRTPPSDNKYAYILTIEGLETGGIVCNPLFLYPQWMWFERLCKTESCIEVQTRHVFMPANFTPSAILAILSACYGTFVPTQNISITDLIVIFQYSDRLQLPEGPCFAELVQRSREKMLSAVTEENCLEKLLQLWEARVDVSSSFFLDTLYVVFENRDKITLHRMARYPLHLQFLISAYIGHNTVAIPTDFISYATALEQSLTSLQTTT